MSQSSQERRSRISQDQRSRVLHPAVQIIRRMYAVVFIRTINGYVGTIRIRLSGVLYTVDSTSTPRQRVVALGAGAGDDAWFSAR